MEAAILLGRILQRLIDQGFAQVEGYTRFGYIRLTEKSVRVTRESGQDTPVPFARLMAAIGHYQNDPALYDGGPGALYNFGVTHLTSPIFALLHLLPKSAYLPVSR